IRPSREGRQLDVEETVRLIRERAFAEQRVVNLPVAITPPAVSEADRHQLGIKELIETASTSFAGSSPPKRHNIQLAASRLHGVVVPPGGLFSFNKELGPTTLDNGYQIGWGIEATGEGHRTVPSVAGGICQVATTLFQAVFWSGYQIEERNWHLYWIRAYGMPPKGMKGLDATVAEEYGLDFKFINPTEHHLLIQAWTQGDTVTFALYGTRPSWTVEVEGPIITDVVPADPKVVEQEVPDRPWGYRLQVESAHEGFTATIVRRVKQGSDVRTLRLVSRYQPSQNVVLIGTQGRPEATPTATEPTPEGTPGTDATPGAAATPGPTPGETPTSASPTPASTPPPSPSPTAN
ncbi:MAG TPA: VanW family protein, partial [Chloroflexota bacterium]